MEKDCEKEPFLQPQAQNNAEIQTERAHQKSYGSNLALLFHMLAVVAYTIGMIVYISKDAQPCLTSLHQLDRLKIEYVSKAYEQMERSPWSGLPSPAIDEAWRALLEPTIIKVSGKELARNNQSSIEYPDGGYMAWLGAFHELHCIKMVRRWTYRDYYYLNITEKESEKWRIHTDHCLEVLRSAAMCHGDSSLVTFRWTDEKERPMPNIKTARHKCINWDTMVESIEDRVVRREEMTALQNPYFHQ